MSLRWSGCRREDDSCATDGGPHGGIPLPKLINLRARRALCRVAATTCVAVLAIAAPAFASCPDQPVSKPFSQWGDTSSYFLVPGGSLEGSLDDVGWTLSNATLTHGNEPFAVNNGADSQSLTIDGGGKRDVALLLRR